MVQSTYSISDIDLARQVVGRFFGIMKATDEKVQAIQKRVSDMEREVGQLKRSKVSEKLTPDMLNHTCEVVFLNFLERYTFKEGAVQGLFVNPGWNDIESRKVFSYMFSKFTSVLSDNWGNLFKFLSSE